MVNMSKLRMMLLLAVIAIMITACGTKQAANQNETSSGASPATETSAANAGTEAGTKGTSEQPKQEELTIKHQLGETKVKKNPEKVVVFDFGSLDTLDKLGIEITALPKSNIPEYLSKYKDDKYINVGTLQEPDFEKINEIQPDLVIISGRQSSLYEEFSKIAPTIFLGVDTTRYMESFHENAKTIGQIFGKESEVEQELAKIDEVIAKLHEKATSSGKNALVVLANDGKVSAYGPGSRFGLIHDVFGLAPVDSNIEVSTHGQSISFEYIVEKDPDYLLVIDRGAVVGGKSSAAQVVENELVKNTKAYKNGNVIYLDPGYWYLSGGGLVSVAEMVREVDEGLK